MHENDLFYVYINEPFILQFTFSMFGSRHAEYQREVVQEVY